MGEPKILASDERMTAGWREDSYEADALWEWLDDYEITVADLERRLGETRELLAHFTGHYQVYHQDLNYEDTEVYRCNECGELESSAHAVRCPVELAEAILHSAKEG